MWLPKPSGLTHPSAGRRNNHLLGGLVALLCFAGLTQSAGPVPEKGWTDQGQATPAQLGPATPAAPYTPPGDYAEILNNLMDEHRAYLDKLGPIPGQEAQWPEYPVHLFAEGGFWMLHTYFSRNPAFLANGPGPVGRFPNNPVPNFDYNVNFAPHVAVGGVTAGGFGLRGSWQQLDAANATPIFPSRDPKSITTVSSVPVFAVPGFTSPEHVAQNLQILNDGLQFTNNVRLTVCDLEGFKIFQGERWSALLGGGARYTYLSMSYRATRFNNGTAKVGTTTLTLTQDSDFLSSGRNFAGAGPTAVVELRRRFGRTPFSVYASVHESVLFGQSGTQSFQSTVEKLKTVPAKGPPSTLVTTAVVQDDMVRDRTLFMGDYEVGVDSTLNYGRLLLFVRTGLVSQNIFGTGNATSNCGDIGFFGLHLSAGVNY